MGADHQLDSNCRRIPGGISYGVRGTEADPTNHFTFCSLGCTGTLPFRPGTTSDNTYQGRDKSEISQESVFIFLILIIIGALMNATKRSIQLSQLTQAGQD